MTMYYNIDNMNIINKRNNMLYNIYCMYKCNNNIIYWTALWARKCRELQCFAYPAGKKSGFLALFIFACALYYYSYPNIQKKVSNSIIIKRSCLKKKITDISTFLQDRSENFNLQNEDCNIISSIMDQIFDLGENLVLFSTSQNLREF